MDQRHVVCNVWLCLSVVSVSRVCDGSDFACHGTSAFGSVPRALECLANASASCQFCGFAMDLILGAMIQEHCSPELRACFVAPFSRVGDGYGDVCLGAIALWFVALCLTMFGRCVSYVELSQAGNVSTLDGSAPFPSC